MSRSFVAQDAGWRTQTASTTTLRVQPFAEQVDVDLLVPERFGPDVVVWTSAQGRAAAVTGRDSRLRLCRLCSMPAAEWSHRRVRTGARRDGNRLVENHASAAFTFGYNSPLVVQRAHDTLAALRYARALAGPNGRVTLVALDGRSAAWAALARAHAGALADAAVFATDGFRFGSVTNIEDAAFLPAEPSTATCPPCSRLLRHGRCGSPVSHPRRSRW